MTVETQVQLATAAFGQRSERQSAYGVENPVIHAASRLR
jgi:hypothetical protein